MIDFEAIKARADDIDPEIRRLVLAMNRVHKKIYTIDSCCGHGDRPVWIFFRCHELRVLPRLLYYFKACHSGTPNWTVECYTDCAMSFPTFCAVSPSKGAEAYAASEKIAAFLEEAYGPKEAKA